MSALERLDVTLSMPVTDVLEIVPGPHPTSYYLVKFRGRDEFGPCERWGHTSTWELARVLFAEGR